jgi:hypothetical protein
MTFEQFKLAVGPHGRELMAVTACLTQIHGHLESEEAHNLMRQLAEACLAKQWGLDPEMVAAAGAFIEANLEQQNWEFRIQKTGLTLKADIHFTP